MPLRDLDSPISLQHDRADGFEVNYGSNGQITIFPKALEPCSKVAGQEEEEGRSVVTDAVSRCWSRLGNPAARMHEIMVVGYRVSGHKGCN